MWRPKLTACVLLSGVVSLALILPGDVWSQGNPFAEIRAQIAILNDKLEEIQESIENLALNGVEHHTLRWDQNLPAADRFEVLAGFNNQAVVDKETGLVWEQSPPTNLHNWSGARSQCTSRTVGGRKGWRLPSVHELASLVDPANNNPALPDGHPFTISEIDPLYWSATTIADNPTLAWSVNIDHGDVFNLLSKDVPVAVWCVRGGMNADQY